MPSKETKSTKASINFHHTFRSSALKNLWTDCFEGAQTPDGKWAGFRRTLMMSQLAQPIKTLVKQRPHPHSPENFWGRALKT